MAYGSDGGMEGETARQGLQPAGGGDLSRGGGAWVTRRVVGSWTSG